MGKYIIFVSLFFFHCGVDSRRVGNDGKDVPAVRKRSDTTLKKSNENNVNANLLSVIDSAKRISDIFELDDVVKLELTDVSTIGTIGSIVIAGDNIFVLDQTTQLVFRFTLKGHFLSVVGSIGQGPGEYQDPMMLFPGPGSSVVLFDLSGRIIRYSSSGEHLQTIMSSKTRLHPRGPLVWDKEDRMFLCDVIFTSQDAPLHVCMDPLKEEALFGFGYGSKEIGSVRSRNLPTPHVSAMAKIQKSIWVGDSMSHNIMVFDLTGQPITTLGRESKKSTERFFDFDAFFSDYPTGASRTSVSSHMRKSMMKPKLASFLYLDNVVIANYVNAIDIYDTHGRLLKSNLPRRKKFVKYLLFSSDRFLLEPIVSFFDLEAMDKYEPLLATKLRELNYNSDDNPYVAIYTLKGNH